MYWQIKALFTVVVLSVIGGLGYWGWSAFGDKIQSTEVDGGDSSTTTTPPKKDIVRDFIEEPVDIINNPEEKDINPRILPTLKLARKLLDPETNEYNPVKARKIVRNVLKNPDIGIKEYSRDWEAVSEVLSDANTKIIFSDMPAPEKKVYEVRPGDSMARIKNKFRTTVGLLLRANNSNSTIFPGQVLRIYEGDWNLKVSKKHLLMTLYDGDEIFKVYEVGLGKENRTPTGTFYVKTKQKEPDWYDVKSGKKYVFGDPLNPLGTRWMSLQATGATARTKTLRGYGIHGTSDPSSIRKYSSRGCMRMHNEDVEELFDIVPGSIPVIIIE